MLKAEGKCRKYKEKTLNNMQIYKKKVRDQLCYIKEKYVYHHNKMEKIMEIAELKILLLKAKTFAGR